MKMNSHVKQMIDSLKASRLMAVNGRWLCSMHEPSKHAEFIKDTSSPCRTMRSDMTIIDTVEESMSNGFLTYNINGDLTFHYISQFLYFADADGKILKMVTVTETDIMHNTYTKEDK